MKGVALITGGTRGIGLGIAKALAREGYHLAINGVRNENEVTGVIAELKKSGGDVIYCRGNIAERSDRNAIVEKTFDHFQEVNVLVNNAGRAALVRRHMLEITEEAYDELMDINLKGTFFLTQSVANRMIASKQAKNDFHGSIITISSISAEFASTNRAEYCLSKAGLSMMTRLFAIALSEFYIPVFEVRPGIIDTDMISAVRDKYEKLIQAGLTLEKRWGTPEDIGKVVAALVRGDIPYATGQVITPDGGLGVRRF